MGSSAESRNPLIKRLLTSYRISSENSLSGPTELKLEKYNVRESNSTIRFGDNKVIKEQKNKDGFLRCAMFMTMDNAFSGLTSTELEGETIACFKIGGENRLCLAQILKSILSTFTLPEIHAVFESLHIFSAICSPAQLKCLKEKEIIPPSAQKCGLITKSDAQRFCSVLLRGGNLSNDKKRSISKEPFTRRRLSFVYEQGSVNKSDCFGVAHKCFGGCRGTLVLKLYESSHSPCIQCNECMMLLSPDKFVSHFHAIAENRQTCHWGFDSANWRHYLELDPRELPEHKDTLLKIKQFGDHNLSPIKDHPVKRLQAQHHHHHHHHHSSTSSTTPSIPCKTSKGCMSLHGLVKEPPPLIQPVTYNDRADMEGFAPNVSLLPSDGVIKDSELLGEEKRSLNFREEEEDDDDDDDDFGSYRKERDDDDDDDDDDDCDGEYDAKCLRRNKVLTSISDEDVVTIQQLDEIQEMEVKLFRMALNGESTEADKATIFNEFCSLQSRFKKLLENLVTKNKDLSQKHKELSCQRDKKDLSTTANWLQKDVANESILRRLHKKRHCQTASPALCPVKKTGKTADDWESDEEESNGESTCTVPQPLQTSPFESPCRPPKRKRCNTYSSSIMASAVKMETC